VRHVGAELAGLANPTSALRLAAVEIDLTATLVHHVTDLADVRLDTPRG